MPRKNPLAVDEYLDETEVQTRMSQILFGFKLFDLNTIDWDASFKDLGMDSLETTAVLTSFEHEFHTVFEDTKFDHFDTLN